ncbi:MAG TPA: hypothetical protein VGL70_04800 [Candidatus Binatia bacterium]|jgi:hypothetical protein
MHGDPSHFEAIGSRLGFRVATDGPTKFVLVWQGARFPAFLCLGIAIALLFISVPIVEALRQRGFEGPAASLWYFPLMNLILLGIAAFLLSIKRTIVFDRRERKINLVKRSIFRTQRFSADYDEVIALRLGTDQVYSGFALAGSTAAETYAVPSLRLIIKGDKTVLLDRGGMKKLESLGARLSALVEKPLESEKQPKFLRPES